MGICQARKSRPAIQEDIKLVEDVKVCPVREVLKEYHKLSQIVGLLGNTDELYYITRERLNNLSVLKSNIEILIQHQVKKYLRLHQIVRQPSDEDEKYLYDDEHFLKMVIPQIQKIINILLILQSDLDFELAYPILSVSFSDLRQELQQLKLPIFQTKTIQTTVM